MKAPKKDSAPFMSSVKVGPKGQIVIPKEARDMFGIEPGDTLILLAHPKKGIAVERPSFFAKLADAIFTNKAEALRELGDSDSADDPEHFAGKLIDILSDIKEEKQ
ncbi:MAG: AbrB/MazE/SpoVT family DNA-binding domain-containing protein [Oscillospiraceae bacterium]